MPTGIAATKQATTNTIGNNTSSLNKHHNWRWQHHHPQQRRNNNRRPDILWQHWTTRCHQHQRHRHFSQSNSPTGWEQSRYHDRQWSSNRCLPTTVCAQHTHVQLGTWTRTTTENSNRWKHTSVWVQMGPDDQRQQATTSCSVLCVRSDTTQLVSNKTGRTRVQHTTTKHTEELWASYNGWHTHDQTSAMRQRN